MQKSFPVQFFKQIIKGSCNIIAIQQTLSILGDHLSFEEVRNELPVHSYGSWIGEIALFFADRGYQTKLLTNTHNAPKLEKDQIAVLDTYRSSGEHVIGLPRNEDISNFPVIVNVDAVKIRKQEGSPSAHYIVLQKVDDDIWMYDGNNFDKAIRIEFDEIYKFSQKINGNNDNGMWLFVNPHHLKLK